MVSIRRHARDWRLYAAVGIAAGLIGSSVQGKENGQHPPGDSEQHPFHVALPSSPAPKPYVYSYSCDRPQSAEQDSLCTERRAADAAVESARWTKRTFWIGFWGTFAVVLTALVSGVAAWAAQRSARAAEEAVQKSDEILGHAEEASERELRAYLFIKEAIIRNPGDGLKWFADIVIENGGKTPAYGVTTVFSIEGDIHPIKKPIPAIPDPSDGGGNIVGPNGQLGVKVELNDDMTAAHVVQLVKGKAVIWVTGRIDYRDIYGVPQWVTCHYFTGGDSGYAVGELSPWISGNAASEEGQYQRRRRT